LLPSGTVPFESLKTACECLTSTDYDRFWTFAALTDQCYEEGARVLQRRPKFPNFSVACESLGSPDGCGDLALQLRQGINGNLAAILDRQGTTILSRNRSLRPGGKRPDIFFDRAGRRGIVESKMIFDCTLIKQYKTIAADRDKLLSFADDWPGVAVLQVVFFVQLPAYAYPSGTWYDYTAQEPRSVKKVGIMRQFNFLNNHLPPN
jgi:hypothetical protein